MPHFAALIVHHRLSDLALRVHHKWAIADNRLVDGLPAQKKKFGVFQRFEGEHVAIPVHDSELRFDDRLTARKLDPSFENEKARRVSARDLELDFLSRGHS